MTKGFRRTAEGVELTHRTVRAVLGLLALVVFATAYALRTAERVAGAVQRPEFTDTTNAVRSDMRSLAMEVRRSREESKSISCYIAKYPASLCDDVPRASQAGQQRHAR